MAQDGAYARGEIEILIEHDNTVLAEIQDFKYDFDVPTTATGAGAGDLENKRFKRTGPPKGTWSTKRNLLAQADKGELLEQLLAGAACLITEQIATSSTTHTPAQSLVSIIEIKLDTSGTVLDETDDYTVNYATGVVTFNTALAEAAHIKYLSDDTDRLGRNLISNGGFESDLTNIWEAISCTLARSTTTPYAGSYKGALTAINAQNDGIQYLPDVAVVPGRTYRLWFYAKAAAADDCTAQWTDAGGSVAMTAVGSAATFDTSWKLHEFTFTPDEATILNIKILNSDATPGATVDIDEVHLAENAPTFDPMEGGNNFAFIFNVLLRRKEDGVVVKKFKNCAAFKDSGSLGDIWSEDISGEFLGYEGE